MKAAAISAAISLVELLLQQIPVWIAQAKEKGELTAEQEAEYQERQSRIFAQPHAQPEPEA